MISNATIIKYERLIFKTKDECGAQEMEQLEMLVNNFCRLNRHETAIACLRHAVFYHPDEPNLWELLGRIYQEAGMSIRARRCSEEAARLRLRKPTLIEFDDEDVLMIPALQ